jgi:cytoskeletal protein CcmA (bactofilin family)
MVGLGVVAFAVLGWIVERKLPSGVEWRNPFRLQGAYEMAFDLLFLIRDQVPGMLELVAALAGLASVSLVFLFALSVVSRRFTGTIALGLAEDDVYVAAGQTVDRTMIVNADTVRVDGVVDGDLVVLLAERLVIGGEVRGNVFSSARTIEISGAVRGNLHAIGETVRLDGDVGGNMYSLSELVTLAADGRVGRDSSHVAAGANVEGGVGRDLFVLGNWVEIRGAVARNVDARADRVALLDTARLGGDLDALLWKKDELDIAPGAVVAGEIRSSLHERVFRSRFGRYARGHFYLWLCIQLAAAFVVGIVLYALVPWLFAVHLPTAGAFFRSLGLGFVVVVATPIGLVLIGITLLGIPLALIALAFFLMALYLSGIVIAAMLGTQITRPRADSWRAFGVALLVGLAVLIIAAHLPFVGFPIRILAMLVGLGLLVERVRSGWRAIHAAA